MRSLGDRNPKAEGRNPKVEKRMMTAESPQRPDTNSSTTKYTNHTKNRTYVTRFLFRVVRVFRRGSSGCIPSTSASGFRASAFGLLSTFGLRPSGFISLALPLACLLTFSTSQAQSLPDATLTQIRFDQKPNAQVSIDLAFVDESGKQVRLRQYFGSKPVVMVLGYYECPMLCTLVLNGFMQGAEDMKWSIGREFDVVSISISPSETPALASAKQRAYVRRYGRAGSAQGWHFLTGNETQIRQLAEEVGFRYAYDPASKQYAHPSGIIILTPDGRVSSYLFGVTFPARDLFAGLQRASVHKVSSPIQQLILLCFHYNPITGKYSGLILIVLRIFGAFTMLGVLGLIIVLVRRGRAAQASLNAAEHIPAVGTEPSASMKGE
jgi:protein SCO1/2